MLMGVTFHLEVLAQRESFTASSWLAVGLEPQLEVS
jgi:hypothetical protein